MTYTYRNGLLVEKDSFSMTYDEHGNITGLTKPYRYGGYKVFKWEYTYDARGNWVERKQFKLTSGDIEIKTLECITTRNIEYRAG